MNNQLIVVADADSIVAQAIASDSNHQLTLKLAQKLADEGAHILFPATAIAEAVTALQRKFSDPQLAASTLELFTDPNISIENIDQEVITDAKKLFDPRASKKNTLFDCIVAAVAKKHNADAIFSLDGWYTKLGFKLVSEVYPQQIII